MLDATHPFAVRITQIAAAVCSRIPAVHPLPAAGLGTARRHGVRRQLCRSRRYVTCSRILLTIGAKQLKYFTPLHDRLTLFARVLPSPLSVQQALDAGFAQANIIAVRPPFSLEFNQSILRGTRLMFW